MTTVNLPSSMTNTAIHKYSLCRLLKNKVFQETFILARSGGISGTGGGVWLFQYFLPKQ